VKRKTTSRKLALRKREGQQSKSLPKGNPSVQGVQRSLRRVPKKPQKPNDRSYQTRDRALNALNKMRREHLSLSKACREEHIKPATLRRYVGSALRQEKPGGRFRATAGDSFRRDLQIPTAQGMTAVRVYGSKNASLIANYLNAVSEYLRTGKRTKLDSFKGKTLKVDGKVVELVTDPTKLSPLAEADMLHFDQLYASATGRG